MQKREKIIIGGISAGTSAAAKIRRLSEDTEIVIYEKDKYISYATCGLPYFISSKIPRLSNIMINGKELFSQRFNLTVKTLHEVLGINPKRKIIDAFGAAKDPINLIGMTCENFINNDVDFINCEELKDKINSNEDLMLIDVRTQREYDFGHIENAVLINIDSFRDNIEKIDKNKLVVLYCRTGYRAYLAHRILKNYGFSNMV